MSKSLQCVIVTPERAILDERADFIVLPMIDGGFAQVRSDVVTVLTTRVLS